ncbi:MAG: response regulator [Lachnospiraceae bacterium]|nr:response regulator [Lachnospiraceae bacterium]
MNNIFSEKLKKLRTERQLSQQQLAEMLFVDRSTIARWESGQRMPEALILPRLAKSLDVDLSVILDSLGEPKEIPNVILLDDEKIILSGGIPILEQVLPNASITGFTKPSEALKFAASSHVSLALLDIELGKVSGLEICKKLLDINPRTNVIFLTAFLDYSFNAWDSGACGFILKPLSEESLKKQLLRLRYPVNWG